MSASRPLVIAALSAALAAPADGALYSFSGGYQYTAGNEAYWGHEAWGYGSLRLGGGWYPYGRLSVLTDANYERVLAPALGLQKGFPGVGRARAEYAQYRGVQRETGLSGASHAGELGFFRVWAPRFSTDFLYRWVSGDLFAGSDAVLGPDAASAVFTRRHAVVHQAGASAVLDLRRGPRLSASVSGSSAAGQRRTLTQSAGLALPLGRGFWAHASLTLAQGAGTDRRYVSGGLYHAFSGRTRYGW